jgi:type I restriction enzyme M protein
MGINERKTEDMVERRLRALDYYAADSGVTVEKQSSDTPRINKLLEHASKSGSGAGKPEFIIRSDKVSDFIIIIECKASPTKHESVTRNKYNEFAVDGALLYASFLSKDLDVLAIAVSGQDEASFRVSHFLHLRGSVKAEEWNAARDMVSFDDYYQAFITSDIKFRQDYEALLDYSRTLNHELESKKIIAAQRGFLISGILIALKNKAFCQSYESHQTAKQLKSSLLETIGSEFENAQIPAERREILAQAFSFFKTLPAEKEFIVTLIKGIDDNINVFMRTHEFYDTIGRFYIEFLRYANNDKGLGIVLTPHHIAGLFAMLADVNKDSIVFDNCCGTAGLLIAAMEQMVKDAGADTKLQTKIKKRQLFGIEFQPNVYALAACNMILHNDGKTNVNRGDCFVDNRNVFQITEGKTTTVVTPTVGILNPPYKNKKRPDDPEELAFVLNNLEHLAPGGQCVAIVPITCATNPGGNLKRRLLERHTLEAVMSMPIELFHNSKTNVVTCVMVFTAHKPHPRGKKTWFGYWRDDGLVKTKNRGRVDVNGMWLLIRERWIQAYRNREVSDGFSVMQIVGPEDEWCAESYLATDYDSIDLGMLFDASRKYVVSQIMNQTAV